VAALSDDIQATLRVAQVKGSINSVYNDIRFFKCRALKRTTKTCCQPRGTRPTL